MLYLITGAPGGGKSLSGMELICKVRDETPDRIIYSNIKGICVPGVIVVDDEWIRDWYEHCGNNCLIVVDEAQKFWRSSRSGDLPKAITDLELHRHDGIDIVMITQHPTLIHANIRKLVTRHIHVVEYTKSSSLKWEWREAHDDVQDKGLRASGDFTEWHYPTKFYELYRSAEVHTKRTKRPQMQVKARILGGVAISLFLGLVGCAVYYGPGLLRQARGLGHVATHSPTRAVHGDDSPGGVRAAPATKAEYIGQFVPRVPAMPWSAPAYDSQAVTVHPQIWCASMDEPKKCRCITEQGTSYAIEDATCRMLVETGGMYDPYRAPAPAAAPVQGSTSPAGATRQDVQSSPMAVASAMPGQGQGAHVGSSYTPPELTTVSAISSGR